MTKLTSFDKNNLGNVRAALDTALAQVEKEFGIKIKVGNIKFTAESFKASLEAMVGADDPVLAGVDPKYVQEIVKYINTKDLFKAETTIGGVKSTVVGMKPRTSGQTVVIRRSNDNSLRLVDIGLVKAGLTDKSLDRFPSFGRGF